MKRILGNLDTVEKSPGFLPRGRMYEVNISADPAHFLDWDRPLKDQPAILEAAKRMGPDVVERVMREKYSPGKQFNDIVANSGLPLGQATDANISAAMREAGIPGIKYLDQGSRAPGGLGRQQLENSISILRDDIARLEKTEGGDLPRLKEKLSSSENALAAMPKASSNYVVFDDKLIDILRKYGIAGLPAAGVAAGAMQPQPSPDDMVNAIRGSGGG